jgi:valyl-tRNA synthetase
MDKTYNPEAIETYWYQIWEKSGFFTPDTTCQLPYCIMLPPPNVTGSLHMGHGFQDTLMDALIRYQRMCGKNTLWQTGVDHAGIATQMVVERQLLTEGKSRHDLGRDAFIERVWGWKAESGNQISQQLRRLGASMDWTRERFTMDEGFTYAVREVFIRLYEENLIYRGQRLVNWDPILQTAVSDLEVLPEETQGELWYIRYPLENSQDFIVVATTRPETLLGDVAVAVHPEDKRYSHLLGQRLKLPLTNRTIPIIADAVIDPTFGTGCVKITPAHDFNDYAIGQRHNLPLINIFTPDARLNEQTPAAYQGLDRFAARKKIIEDLIAENFLEKTEPHTLKIPKGDRSGAIIEPYLTYQWFMQMKPLAEPAIDVVKQGKISFIPENWNKTYFQWLDNIEDWCISRQLWWGHRIPAWYDDAGQIYVGHDEASIRERYQLSADTILQQETDVLDTWFSSALWPFATLGWPENTAALQTYYPTSVLVTGFDIIFFWVARMVMLGLKFTGKIPFKEVYVTGLIRDQDGQKMSKSKGNVLDPIDLIDGIDLDKLIQKRTTGLMQPAMAKKITDATQKQFPKGIPAFGTDALRFTYCALAGTSRDIRFDLNRVSGYRNFCNKLWNAARFVLMNTEDKHIEFTADSTQTTLADRWILSRLQIVTQQVHQHFKDYRFDLLAQTVYEFIWNEYCDWYLEFTKPILLKGTTTQQNSTRYTLLSVLENSLRLLHPLMPFITETIWQRVAPLLGKNAPTLMLQPYPKVNATLINTEACEEIEWLQAIILQLRAIRSEMVIAPGRLIPLVCNKGNQSDKVRFEKHQALIQTLAKVEHISWLAENEAAPQAAFAFVGELQLLIPMAGLIDIAAETARLQKELNKVQQEYERIQQKLSNISFVQNAPEAVVAKEKARQVECHAAIEKLQGQLAKL